MTSTSLLPDRTTLLPELPRSEIRAFTHRLELLPNDGGMDLGTVEGLGREAAIGARDHVLATDQLRKAQEPLGDELGMLDDIAGVSDDAGNEHLAFRDFDALKEVVLVLVPRIGGLEAERPGVDLKYVVDDLRQACLVEPRPLVDAIARVEPHTLPRNPLNCGVSCLDIEVGAPLHLLLGEAGFEKDVRQERIVDLEQEAGRDDHLVFVPERSGDGVEVLFLGLVILVASDT